MISQEEKVEIIKEEKKEPEFKSVPPEEKNSKHIAIYITIFVGVLLLILLIIFIGFTFYNLKNNNVIVKGIYIYGTDVSGKTKKEALSAISDKFETIQKTDIKLISKDYETVINPSEINLKFDINSAINYAFSIGKTGNIFTDNYDVFTSMINGINIIPTCSLNENELKSILTKLSKEIPEAIVENSYYIENSNLIITKGHDGYVIDSNKTASDIKNKIKDLSFLSQPIELTLVKQSPKEIALEQIYKEIRKDPKDAYFTTKPYAVYPSENGIDFKISMEEAKQKLANSDKECTIALKTVYPKITTNMLGREAFPDLLGEFSTYYAASNTNRTTNLKLAAKKINGTVLLPGETFSYNKVVGERTIAAGYKEAAIYQNGEVVDGLGGGICQISTTLFNAALFANLDIVELHNHQFVPSYVNAGRDATVVYGAKDFQFLNSRNHAIKIECSVSGGIAKFKIYGVKEDTEYTIKVNAQITSQTDTYTKSSTYRTLYLKGKKVSTEKIYSCTYKRH